LNSTYDGAWEATYLLEALGPAKDLTLETQSPSKWLGR
jgi:hypothetical protein